MTRRRVFAPEVIQTSSMDCGPAALTSLMGGFLIPVSYGRLREACHTDVDGTSIDTIEEIAVRLGLKAEQVIVPPSHLTMPEAASLPCIAIVKIEGGGTHFVVVWRKLGPLLQVMDPGAGRHWTTVRRFLDRLYVHEQRIPVDAFLGWAGGEEFAKPLLARMKRVGVAKARARQLLDAAVDANSWREIGALTAAVELAEKLNEPSLVELASRPDLIPADFWNVSACEDGDEEILFRGAVVLRANGVQEADLEALPESLRSALSEKAPSAAKELWDTVRAGGLAVPLWAMFAAGIAAGGTLVEAVLLRSLFTLAPHLPRMGERFAAAGVLAAFLLCLAAIEWAMEDLLRATGRGLETRLRARFAFKIPRLGDRYFQSRLISDMAQRAHAVQALRNAPPLLAAFLRILGSIAATTAGIAWFFPESAWQALLCGTIAAAVPLLGQPWLVERDLRFREYGGALSRFYLDALLGIVPIRTHGAGPALRWTQSEQLGHWAAAGLRMQRTAVTIETLQLALSYGAAAWLVFDAMQGPRPNAAALILLVYWALSLPELGRALGAAAWQWPAMRNSLLRLLEPLGAPEEALVADPGTAKRHEGGASIAMRGVGVGVAGHPILRDIDLAVEPGEHIGIVGLSGAGKSSLVGLLLGWYKASTGAILVDGEPLTAAKLHRLRGETAWVDPQVQLWNDTLLNNLCYGLSRDQSLDAARAVERANLSRVIQNLPEGMQSALGEGGALVSGGEGQRVRMARAYGKPGVRLAILDEPARGLDRGMREEFVQRAREAWQSATLLCITHDVASTKAFPRVLVIEDGRIVEDGDPSALYADEDSRYRRMCDGEDKVREQLWSAASWRRVRMEEGVLRER